MQVRKGILSQARPDIDRDTEGCARKPVGSDGKGDGHWIWTTNRYTGQNTPCLRNGYFRL